MDAIPEDRFVVFVHEQGASPETPEAVEQEVTRCATYEEACRVKRAYQTLARPCVIRYLGSEAGGGD